MNGAIGNVSYFANVTNSPFSFFVVVNHMGGGLLALSFLVVLLMIVAYAMNRRGYSPFDTGMVACFFCLVPAVLFWTWQFDGVSMVSGWIPLVFGVFGAGFAALSRSQKVR